MSYDGESNAEGQPHGRGTITYASGAVYEGEWKEGKKQGQGTFINANGDVFKGEIKEDKMHGQGTFTYVSGAVYEGEWKEDRQHGQGTYAWPNGEVYKGEHKDGKQHGQGTYTWSDGNVYKGEYKDDLMHGLGTYTNANGVYEGEYRDGKKHGQGTNTYASGNIYKGEWKEDKMHGQGTYTNANETILKGEWKEDKIHGQGTFTYANGEVYEGEHKDGNRHGPGTFTRADGATLRVLAELDKFTKADGERVDATHENFQRALDKQRYQRPQPQQQQQRLQPPAKRKHMAFEPSSDESGPDEPTVFKSKNPPAKRKNIAFEPSSDESSSDEPAVLKSKKRNVKNELLLAKRKVVKKAGQDKTSDSEEDVTAAGATQQPQHTQQQRERVDATHENFQRVLDKQRTQQQHTSKLGTGGQGTAGGGAPATQQPQEQRNTPEFSVDYSSKLGAGGQGTVYKGFDNVSKKPIAVKVQPGGDLSPEFKLLIPLKHPNIVEVLHFDDGSADTGLPIPKIFLEFVEGGSLDKCISPAAPLPEEEIRRHLSSVLHGLAHCHAQVPPVWHRDIKPANMLLSKDGNLKLTDFGSGKAQGKTGQTMTVAAGTWVYMAPEACVGKPCAASDVWSLASSVVEMASGKKPWHETGLKDVTLASHISMSDPPLNHFPTVPQSLSVPLQAMLRKMFAHNPEDRGTAASHLKDPYFTNEIRSPAPKAGGGGAAASAFPEWLQDLDISDAARNIMVQNEINETSFLLLDGDDLKELGVAFGPRKVLLNEIAKRKAQ